MPRSAERGSEGESHDVVAHVELEDEWADRHAALESVFRGHSIRVTVMEITPEMALAWLANNNRNPRKIRNPVWRRYANDMGKGAWAFPVDFIGMDVKGNIVQGQHRLRACAETDACFRSIVVYGVPEEAIEAMDRGLKRALADTFAGRGYANARDLQSAVRTGWRWDNGVLLANQAGPTDAEGLEWLEANPGIIDAVTDALRAKVVRMKTSVMAPLFYRACLIDEDAARIFVDRVISGVNLSADDPTYKLRQAALNRGRRSTGNKEQAYDLAIAVKAWNAHVRAQPLRALKWSGQLRKEAFPAMCDRRGVPFKFAATKEFQFEPAVNRPESS